jgi:toxin CcdB
MRFDLYLAPAGGKPKYLLDVQADLLEEMPTRIVVPLFDEPRLRKPLQDLQPCFEVNGERMTMMTQDLASVPKRLLRRKVTSLAEHREKITRALDLLFTGF